MEDEESEISREREKLAQQLRDEAMDQADAERYLHTGGLSEQVNKSELEKSSDDGNETITISRSDEKPGSAKTLKTDDVTGKTNLRKGRGDNRLGVDNIDFSKRRKSSKFDPVESRFAIHNTLTELREKYENMQDSQRSFIFLDKLMRVSLRKL